MNLLGKLEYTLFAVVEVVDVSATYDLYGIIGIFDYFVL